MHYNLKNSYNSLLREDQNPNKWNKKHNSTWKDVEKTWTPSATWIYETYVAKMELFPNISEFHIEFLSF